MLILKVLLLYVNSLVVKLITQLMESTLFYYTSCNGKNPSSAMTQTCKKPYVVDVLELIDIIRKDANNE